MHGNKCGAGDASRAAGRVYLVGAGPGDPGLITVRGLQCLARSDLVVYDRLANRRLLEHAPREAERVYVGKEPHRHAMKQEAISRLLVEEAQKGRVVTRLKGGDPFVFGRGGEEALLLAANGVPFEVVPGVTSAVAVPAYAGIPVTHRDVASSLSIITGHEDPQKGFSSLDWANLAAARGTRVFLMGVGSLQGIAQNLLEHGCPPATPVALIRWGTLPEQESLVGPLEEIAAKAEAQGFRPPAVLVVGEVVRLREQLQWVEKRPLFGRRVLVTRSREQASRLTEEIEARGGEVYEFPTIEIVPPEDFAELDAALARIATYQWLVFTSVNGVQAFFQRCRQLRRDIRDLQGLRLCAVGPATLQELENRGFVVEFTPLAYRSEVLLQELSGLVQPGEKILLPRGNLAWPDLPRGLANLGARVDDVVVYQTMPGRGDAAAVREMMERGRLHAVTFTSSSTARNFVELLGIDGAADPRLQGITLVSIGPATTRTARELGLPIDLEAQEHTIEGLVEALVRALSQKGPRPGRAVD